MFRAIMDSYEALFRTFMVQCYIHFFYFDSPIIIGRVFFVVVKKSIKIHESVTNCRPHFCINEGGSVTLYSRVLSTTTKNLRAIFC
jgi:hypothetical protein